MVTQLGAGAAGIQRQRPEMLLKILHCTGQPPPCPPAKSYLAQNANGTEMEKFWSRLKSLSDNFFRNTLLLRYFNTIDILFICLCTLCISVLYTQEGQDFLGLEESIFDHLEAISPPLRPRALTQGPRCVCVHFNIHGTTLYEGFCNMALQVRGGFFLFFFWFYTLFHFKELTL